MDSPRQLLVSPAVIDLILLAILIEGLVLVVVHRLSGHGIAPRALLPNLVAGGCLFLALRLVLVDAAVQWPALALLAALMAHIGDLALRWPR